MAVVSPLFPAYAKKVQICENMSVGFAVYIQRRVEKSGGIRQFFSVKLCGFASKTFKRLLTRGRQRMGMPGWTDAFLG